MKQVRRSGESKARWAPRRALPAAPPAVPAPVVPGPPRQLPFPHAHDVHAVLLARQLVQRLHHRLHVRPVLQVGGTGGGADTPCGAQVCSREGGEVGGPSCSNVCTPEPHHYLHTKTSKTPDPPQLLACQNKGSPPLTHTHLHGHHVRAVHHQHLDAAEEVARAARLAPAARCLGGLGRGGRGVLALVALGGRGRRECAAQ